VALFKDRQSPEESSAKEYRERRQFVGVPSAASVTANLRTGQVNADSRVGRAEASVEVDSRAEDSVVDSGGKVTLIAFMYWVYMIKGGKE
jgi:hypothetical protein